MPPIPGFTPEFKLLDVIFVRFQGQGKQLDPSIYVIDARPVLINPAGLTTVPLPTNLNILVTILTDPIVNISIELLKDVMHNLSPAFNLLNPQQLLRILCILKNKNIKKIKKA